MSKKVQITADALIHLRATSPLARDYGVAAVAGPMPESWLVIDARVG